MTRDVLIKSDKKRYTTRLTMSYPRTLSAIGPSTGPPRQTGPGRTILFSDGDAVIAKSMITAVEDGRIWFNPLQFVNEPQPREPPTRVFCYVEGDER